MLFRSLLFSEINQKNNFTSITSQDTKILLSTILITSIFHYKLNSLPGCRFYFLNSFQQSFVLAAIFLGNDVPEGQILASMFSWESKWELKRFATASKLNLVGPFGMTFNSLKRMATVFKWFESNSNLVGPLGKVFNSLNELQQYSNYFTVSGILLDNLAWFSTVCNDICNDFQRATFWVFFDSLTTPTTAKNSRRYLANWNNAKWLLSDISILKFVCYNNFCFAAILYRRCVSNP